LAILPPWLREAMSLEGLILWLSLEGVITGEFAGQYSGQTPWGCRRRPVPLVMRADHGDQASELLRKGSLVPLHASV
jgi:hypothetical protein